MAEYVREIRKIVGGEILLQVPSVSIALRDAEGRVLLARHVETERWLLPGGAIEPGENPADAAVREMWEETGLAVSLSGLVGVFGGPEFIVNYRNGDRTSYVMAVFEAHADGSPRPANDELLEMRFVSQADAIRLPVAPWVAPVLEAVFGKERGAFRASTWVRPD